MEILENISSELNVNSLLTKLHIEEESCDAVELETLVDRIRPIVNPKVIYKVSYIQDKSPNTVTIEGVVFTSRILRANLDAVERVFPYIATCGKELDQIDLPPGDFVKEFWLDTIKATVLGFIIKHLNEHLNCRYALGKTSSMSPGAGDATIWPIEQQRQLFSIFGNVEDFIGVCLTDSFLMIPNKSVSGIRFATSVDFRSCKVCHRENCSSRSAPFDRGLWESIQHTNIS